MFRLLLLVCCLLFVFSASADIRVEDDLGVKHSLAEPAQRIVSLAPNITELLFYVGAGGQIIGADEYSNYPEQATQITRVSNYAAANYELILTLQPDLVIAWHSGNGDKIINRIKALGLPVFVIEPRKMADIPEVFRRLGKLTGHDDTASERAAGFRLSLEALAYEYREKSPVRVFYQIWNEPLITLNGKHLISDVLTLCGGENVFAEATPLVPYVNMEGVIKADPQVIIASGSSEDSPAWLDMWQQWPYITAVKNSHVYFIPPDLMQRHSLRILEGARQVCGYLDQARLAP